MSHKDTCLVALGIDRDHIPVLSKSEDTVYKVNIALIVGVSKKCHIMTHVCQYLGIQLKLMFKDVKSCKVVNTNDRE